MDDDKSDTEAAAAVEEEGDRFYRVPASRSRASSEESTGDDAFAVLMASRGRAGVVPRVAAQRRRSAGSDGGEERRTTTVVLTSTGARNLDGNVVEEGSQLAAVRHVDVALDAYVGSDNDEYSNDDDMSPPAVPLPEIGTNESRPLTRDNTAFNAAQHDFVPLGIDGDEEDKMDDDMPMATGTTTGTRPNAAIANERWQSGYRDTTESYWSRHSLSGRPDVRQHRGREYHAYLPATEGDSWVNDESDEEVSGEDDMWARRGRGRGRVLDRDEHPEDTVPRQRLRSPPPEQTQRFEGDEKPNTGRNEEEEDDMDDTDQKTLLNWEALLHATLQSYTKRYELPEESGTDSDDENPDFAGIEEDDEAEMEVESHEVPELGVKPLYGSGYNRDRVLPKLARPKLHEWEEHAGRYKRHSDRGGRHRFESERYQPYRRR
ncbi:hypothetical protein QFC19_000430 [Naganishia cerealis]|uniref:Uncharacterized protein n=1 Tax=Naganishia cerealis TaxID=610337 RepID=A0ACC2WNY3_9TREE|nr:hypothetical protein QFC19_000430 [Naganishia cerealis]